MCSTNSLPSLDASKQAIMIMSYDDDTAEWLGYDISDYPAVNVSIKMHDDYRYHMRLCNAPSRTVCASRARVQLSLSISGAGDRRRPGYKVANDTLQRSHLRHCAAQPISTSTDLFVACLRAVLPAVLPQCSEAL